MAKINADAIISHWNTMLQGVQASSQTFYQSVEDTIRSHHVKDVQLSHVDFAEGGLLSARRTYLQAARKDHVFHICAAPFGDGFFISWWLGEAERGFRAWLSNLPYVGRLFRALLKPLTYYQIDTALMFQSVTHGAVLEVIDGLTNAKGQRALSEFDRKPVMKSFFGK